MVAGTLFRGGIRSFSTSTCKAKKQVCVIGSGPAGFYCAQHLVKVFKEDEIQVDIYEKLPVPFGLVRYGVAPDHPDVKNVINTFTKTAQRSNVEFIGNVSLGKDVSFQQLKDAYHAIVLAYGCNEEKFLGIPGEEKNHVYGARRLVGWYNGLPQDSSVKPNLSHSTAVVLGQGNVAIDVARILLSPIDELRKTDIPETVLAQLAESKVSKVHLVGRRGPLQAAFTIKEFREMTKLPQVSVVFPQMDIIDKLSTYLPDLSRPRKRLTDLMISTATSGKDKNHPKTFLPLFYRKPKKINSDSVTFSCTSADDLLKGAVRETGDIADVEAGLVVRSIGYSGTCLDPLIPFSHDTGTVVSSTGVYGVGWIGSGPTGVILQTMNISFKQAEQIAKDLTTGTLSSTDKPGAHLIKQVLKFKGIEPVLFKDWEKIDQVEKERGAALGKPREKILDVNEMLEIALSV